MNKLVSYTLLALSVLFSTESISKPIAMGNRYNWAIGEKGSVVFWSENNISEHQFSESVLPTGLISIAAGKEHALALDENGNIWRWLNSGMHPGFEQQLGLPLFKAISAGCRHGLMLDQEGNVWRYGENVAGTGFPTQEPIKIESLLNIIAIDSGYRHNLALDADGHLWTWGDGKKGQLGHGDLINQIHPTRINSEEYFTAIAAGGSHSLALDSKGRLWFFGYMLHENDDVIAEAHTLPILVNDEYFVSIAAGINYCIALDINGDVWTWGNGTNGKLGHGSDEQYKLGPTKVEKFSDKPIIACCAGETSSLFLDNSGRLYICGNTDSFERIKDTWPDIYSLKNQFQLLQAPPLKTPQPVKLAGCSHVKSARN